MMQSRLREDARGPPPPNRMSRARQHREGETP